MQKRKSLNMLMLNLSLDTHAAVWINAVTGLIVVCRGALGRCRTAPFQLNEYTSFSRSLALPSLISLFCLSSSSKKN